MYMLNGKCKANSFSVSSVDRLNDSVTTSLDFGFDGGDLREGAEIFTR